ncbi:MAG: hypothetical protein ACRDHV_08915 [Actinomycetota bacterium]
MRAEFFRADAPDRVVGEAEWDGRRAVITAGDDDVRATLDRVFRVSTVAVDDATPGGTGGKTFAEPGDLEWFRAAARFRGAEEGLGVRFVNEVPARWDPALDPETYGWGGRKPAAPTR